MDKKLLITLLVIGALGFGYAFYAAYYIPTECWVICGGGLLVSMVVGIATAFILLLILIVTSIGRALRKRQEQKQMNKVKNNLPIVTNMNPKGFVNILIIIAIVAVLGAIGYYIATRNPGSSINTRQQNKEGVILSLVVEPSTQAQGWMMYRDGAKAVLKGKNLKSVEARYFSTGTGVTESSLAGKMNKVSESPNSDTWEVILPPSILATSFWAEAEDLGGRKIKSANLGNVGYEESKNRSSSLPTTCTDQREGAPVITSLSAYSGSIGTKFEVRGCNFSGFEGDLNAWIENSQGIKAGIYGEAGSTSKLLKITLKSPLCQQDNSYSGLPCSTWLTLVPGTYKVYTMPWGKKSNIVNFTITGDTPQTNPYIKVIDPNGGEIWKIGQLYTVLWEANKPYDAIQIQIITDETSDQPYLLTNGYLEGDAAKAGTYTFTLKNWWVPSLVNGRISNNLAPVEAGKYKIRLVTGVGGPMDSSDKQFSIVQ